ncbi:hypothetical protein UNSW3_666 [Campylobacter concisus UNSW3]|uniref:Uncharacterized protein n=1 Tax=Campylobacter concisus UNSW3 TaxID=1242966 RepID=U2F1J7_9BACT|nr:hypothetical protein [Campylobacter concisus]ERJ24037.1 hypothetical protein UNSW3_666 [Campylobacter concisus UNSW3]
MSIAITILIFLVVSVIVYGMYEKSFNKCLNLGPNEFVERKFLLKTSSLDLSKILYGPIVLIIIIIGLVDYYCNNLTLAFFAGAIVFILYAIYIMKMFIFYIGSGIVITQQRVIVIKSFKPTSFNIDEILYAKVFENDTRDLKDDMVIKDEITKSAITIMDINGRQETIENFPDANIVRLEIMQIQSMRARELERELERLKSQNNQN